MAASADTFYYCWRGVVGNVLPTWNPEALMEFIRLLPDGVGVIQLYGGAVTTGTEAQLRQHVEAAERPVEQLSKLDVDLIAIDGTGPVLLLGYKGANEYVEKLQKKYGKPVLTGAVSQVEALRELGVRRMVGVTYLPPDLNRKFANFYTEAGFEVAAMEGYDVAFVERRKIPPGEIYAFTKKAFLQAGGGDCIYMLGLGWRPLSIIETLEQDLGVPVITSLNAKIRAVLKRLKVRHSYQGYGQLLERC